MLKGKEADQNNADEATADQILSGRGLRGRLRHISAKVGADERVSLTRPAFGDAVIRYVWENYAKVREPFARWLLSLAVENDEWDSIAANLISGLVRRHQDIDFIKNQLTTLTSELDKPEILAAVLCDATLDIHMRRRCERLLYRWAVSPNMQEVVVAVCAKILSTRKHTIALRRLRRVADGPKATSDVHNKIFEIFRATAKDPELQFWFLDEVLAWINADLQGSSPVSTKLAFAAAMHIEINGTPWLLTEDAEGTRIDRMLGEVISDITTIHGADEALVMLVQKAGSDDGAYSRVINRIADSAVAYGALHPIFNLSTKLNAVGRDLGRDPVQAIDSRIRQKLQAPPKYNAAGGSEHQPT
jgi:hypothetical protein